MVSVIIPTYKPGDYIYECLKAVCNQSFSKDDYEIVIVVNGCKEPFVENISSYLKKTLECNYQILQTDIPGVSNARNFGMEKATGEYLVFVDDDDIITNNYLSELYSVSSRNCIGCANSLSFHESIAKTQENFLTRAFLSNVGRPFDIFHYRQFLSPPVCKMIHRDIIGVARFPVTLKRSEDSVFCMSFAHRVTNMKLAATDCIYYIRLRTGSATRIKKNLSDYFVELLKIECAYLKIWVRNPLSLNVRFVASRFAAAIKNFYEYING